MAKLIYIKTDKNGTKYYADYTCPRCGGAGGCNSWAYTGYTCYECGGTGRRAIPKIVKEYTKEYRAKLDERALKREEKARAERIADLKDNLSKYMQEKGFNADGKMYVVTGNTYEIKDELREAGAKFKDILRSWYFMEDTDKYPTVEVSFDDLFKVDEESGYIVGRDVDVKNLIASKMPVPEGKVVSQYVGEVGDKVDLPATLENIYSYDRDAFRGWGKETVRILKFRDEAGNILVWNTTSYWEPIKEGTKVQLSGKIKDHSEYRGEKQTDLIRCKVVSLEPVME